MKRLNGLNLKLAMALLLILAGTASAALKIHVKNPWPGTPMWQGLKVIGAVIAGPPGLAMTDDGDGWYSFTIADALPPNGTFFIVKYSPATWDVTQPDYASQLDFRPGGISKSGPEFNIGDMRTIGEDVWIIPMGGTLPPKITDIPQAKKVAFLFNPWPANAPMAKVGNATAFGVMKQAPEASRCGWYGAYFNAAPFTVSYKSMFGTETYGVGGLGDSKSIDLTSYFATSDTIWLLPDPIPGGPPKITTTIPPGIVGTCAFKLAVTLRDFSKDHPDFDDVQLDRHDLATKGMVASTLDADSKPTVSSKPFMQSDFSNWFRDKKTDANPKLNNVTYCKDLNMTKSSNGLWGYNSLKSEPSHSYFPLDNDNTFGETGISQYIDQTGVVKNDPTAGKHNFNFCMELHASFKYQAGQEFSFLGDDDTWVFINKKLVLDIGGPHPPVAGKVNLDTIGAAGPGKLVAGTDYAFDFFFCERQPTGSDLGIETSIFFEQQQTVYAKPVLLPNGAIRYEIWEVTSGDKSCGSTKGGDTALATSVFKLSGPSVNPAELLGAGTTKYGGVTVNTSGDQVTVDTAKVTGLRPGVYTITYETTNSKRGSTLQFTVSGTYAIEFSAKPPVNEILNTLVPVTVQATLAGVADKRAEVFRFTPQAGLTVYSDSTLTNPIPAGTDLTTLAATGTLKVWVSSATANTYKLDLIGGPGKNVLMDTYNNLTFFEQPKVVKPVAFPPGQIFILPLSVTLSTPTVGAEIFYTTNGSDPATTANGITLKFTAGTPIPVTATLKIKAIAVKPGWINSDIMTEDYIYMAPLGIRNAFYQDLNGDGKIETVILDFEKDIPNTPDKLNFKIVDATGKTNDKAAAKAEIAYAAGSRSRVVVTFAVPFDYGVTSVGNPTVSGQIFKQDNIPSLEAIFPVADSVAPVPTKAMVMEPDSAQLLKRILISVSEPLAAIDSLSQTALVFKRNGVEMASGDVKIRKIEKTGDRDYAVYIDSTSNLFPIVGDSVALNMGGEIKDLAGNAPARKTFMRLDGTVPKPKPMDLYVTFPNSQRDKPSEGLRNEGAAAFIPVDLGGMALTGSVTEGKCAGNCFTGDNANFVGPVFHIVTPGPVTYEFRIFNNHGEFVARGKGVVTATDLPKLLKRNDASGVKYLARIVWTGRTDKGGKAATGAYILQTTLIGEQDARTGAAPGKDNKRVTFGLLRNFTGS